MIEEYSLSFMQNLLQKELMNLNINYIDEYNFNMLINHILHLLNSINQEIQLFMCDIDTIFTKNYILIKSKKTINKLSGYLAILIEAEDNTISNIDISILY